MNKKELFQRLEKYNRPAKAKSATEKALEGAFFPVKTVKFKHPLVLAAEVQNRKFQQDLTRNILMSPRQSRQQHLASLLGLSTYNLPKIISTIEALMRFEADMKENRATSTRTQFNFGNEEPSLQQRAMIAKFVVDQASLVDFIRDCVGILYELNQLNEVRNLVDSTVYGLTDGLKYIPESIVTEFRDYRFLRELLLSDKQNQLYQVSKLVNRISRAQGKFAHSFVTKLNHEFGINISYDPDYSQDFHIELHLNNKIIAFFQEMGMQPHTILNLLDKLILRQKLAEDLVSGQEEETMCIAKI